MVILSKAFFGMGGNKRNAVIVFGEPSVSLLFCASSSVIGEPRTAVLHKGKKGFGFVLRGAKAASPLMEMVPSDRCPGLQYMDDVDPGGVADMAGIRKGDFLLEVLHNLKIACKIQVFSNQDFFVPFI